MATHGIRLLTLTEWHLIAKNIDIQQSQTVLPFSTLKSAHVIQGTCARMPLNVIFFLGIVFDTQKTNSQAEFAWLYKTIGSMLAVRIVYIPREL